MTRQSKWRRVLVVDDGSILFGALGAALGRRGYEVHEVALADGAAALPAAITAYHPDVVLLNQALLASREFRPGEWRRPRPKFLALRQGDQPTDPIELAGSRGAAITICTPADLQTLLP